MTKSEFKTVADVLQGFLTAEEDKPWDRFDEAMYMLTWLNDDELWREVDLTLELHMKGGARCNEDHSAEECSVPLILDAIRILLAENEDVEVLGDSTRYIFEYYLSLDQCDMIVTD